jgi:hypothetical protein
MMDRRTFVASASSFLALSARAHLPGRAVNLFYRINGPADAPALVFSDALDSQHSR